MISQISKLFFEMMNELMSGRLIKQSNHLSQSWQGKSFSEILLKIQIFHWRKKCLWKCYLQNVKHLNGSTHWGRVMHICDSKLAIIGADNGLSLGSCQAIIWNNAGILLIWPLATNFSEIIIEIHTFSLKKMHLKWWSAQRWPFCLNLNMLSKR